MPSSEGIPLRDFLEDAFETIEWSELRAVVQELAEKSRRVQTWLGSPDKIETLSPAEIEAILGMIFVARRHRAETLGVHDGAGFKQAIGALLHGDEPDFAVRVDNFLRATQSANPGMGAELAGELLHFTFPERYWLSSRWMYSRESGTGILPLLMDGDKELRGDTPGQTYLRIGRAIVMVTKVEDAKWLFRGGLGEAPAQRPFVIDTFLAASYCAYLYGVTAWRLTREFHKVLPPLPRLVRRMLGLKIEKAL